MLRESAATLPSPNAVALELMRLVDRRDVGVFEVCRVARGDPVLVGKTVQLANSALYSGLRPTAAIEDAVMRIGVAALARLAVGLSLVHSHGARLGQVELEPFWRRSLARALVLQRLARRFQQLPVSEAFSLGLLADIGLLAMLAMLGADGVGERDSAAELLAWQRERWGFDYLEVGAALLQTWHFPQRLWLALLPQGALPGGHGELHAMVDVARCLGAALDDRSGERELHLLCMGALRLGLDEAALLALLDEARGEFAALASILQIQVSHERAQQDFLRLRERLTRSVDDDGRPASVLLAGPLASARDDLCRALRDEGLDVTTQADPGLAFECARAQLPDAVVLDADNLPVGVDELVRSWREHESARLYLLLLGDSVSGDGMLQALRAGANDVLPSGAPPDVIAAKLRPGVRMARLIGSLERERAQAYGRQRELAALNTRLREAAFSDELTGLPNRRALDEFLARAWGGALAGGRPLSCVLLDLDHFKVINDTHGHETGDRVLRAVAQALQRHCRGDDLLVRWGGEELVLVCPGVGAAEAAALAERMRSAVQGLPSELPAVTLSAGVAQARGTHADSIGEMLRAADLALLQAKRAGRNRIVVADADAQPRPG